jgi:ribosomal protein S18 acetylase RimI-like enzyme
MRKFTDMRKVEVGVGSINCELVYLSEDGGQVGSLLLVYESGKASVFSLEVLEAHRGKGYGRMLMESAISHCRAKGLPVLELNTEKGNVAANRLYGSLGFTLVGEKFGFNNYVLPLHS